MKPASLLAILCLGVAEATPSFDLSLDSEWKEWKIKYGKNYSMTSEEFMKMLTDIPVLNLRKKKSICQPIVGYLPKFVDQRIRGYVTSVKHQEGHCRYLPECSAARITGFLFVSKTEEDLMRAVATIGPISVGTDALHESFTFYREGIYYEPKCGSNAVNHGVLLVSYGYEGRESDGRKYWLIKKRYTSLFVCVLK